MSFTGERLTPDLSGFNPGSLIRHLIEKGPLNPIAIFYLRAEHLSGYTFVAREILLQGKRALDIGCGTGYGSDECLKRGKAGLVVGLDRDCPSEKVQDALTALEYAQGKYGREGLHFLGGLAENLPFPDRTFGVVVSFEVIEHLKDPKLLLRETRRVMADEGVFILSTPNRTLVNPGATIKDKPKNRFHEVEYNKGEFKSLLGEYFDEIHFLGQFGSAGIKSNNWLIKRLTLYANLARLEEVTKVVPLEESQEPLILVAVCRGKKEP